jgi:transposase
MKDYIDTTKSVSSLSEPQERKVRAYKKLSQTAKKELVELIIRQNFSIRRAAKQLSINYSSAKIILSKYRLKQRMLFIPEIKSGLMAQFK